MSSHVENNIVSRIERALSESRPLSEEDTIYLLEHAHPASKLEQELAHKLIGADFRYLKPLDIAQLIDNKLKVEDAMCLVQSRQNLIERATHLIPEIVGIVKPRDDKECLYVLHLLSDCEHDFRYYSSASRKGKREREESQYLLKMCELIEALQFEIKKKLGLFEVNFEVISREIDKDRKYSGIYISDLESSLDVASLAAKLTDYERLFEQEFPDYITGARSCVVEYAYNMIIRTKSIRLVTTPNSQFSMLCSYIFEIFTGEMDQSFSGSINKFARSQARREADLFEEETERQNSDEYIASFDRDNFKHIREQAYNIRRIIRKYKRFKSKVDLTPTQIVIINNVMDNMRAEIVRLLSGPGPHLVWAHQLPASESSAYWQGMNEIVDRITLAKFHLGNLDRALRGS